MKTSTWLMFVALTGALVAGCGKTSYKKTAGGMPYKLYPGKDTQKVVSGSYIKVTVTQKHNDSVMFTTDGGLPVYLMVSGEVRQPYDISELWTSLKKGDSVVTTQMVDTFIKRAPDRMPPNFKNGDRIYTYFKIQDIFMNDSLARLDEEKTRKEFALADSKKLEKQLADKKISFTEKTPSGAFVQVIKRGEGPLADTGNIVTVNYTGSSLEGVAFDSNVDSSFGHVGPYSYNAGQGEMIQGFDEAVMMMQRGGKVKVYIPSMLAYGANGRQPKIKPYEHLVFDLELLDIKPPANKQGVLPPQVQQKIDAAQSKGK